MTDTAQPGRPWWRANLPTAVAGTGTALALLISLGGTPPADASDAPAAGVAQLTGPQRPALTLPTQETAPASNTPAVQVIAHRGGVVWGPEHTFATYDHMLEVGPDAVELDVRLTRDRVPVVFHDADLERTTDCTGRLADRSLAWLSSCDSGSWFGASFVGSRVQTLNATLARLRAHSRTLGFFLHMKSSRRGFVTAVMRVLERHGLDDGRTTALCNSKRCLDRFTKAGVPRVGFVFNDPKGWRSDRPVLVPYNIVLSREAIRAAQRRGQIVLAVENHPLPARELIALGLDGVMADDLDAVLQIAGRPAGG